MPTDDSRRISTLLGLALPILGVLVIPFLWRALTGEGSGATLDILGAVLVALTAGGLVLLVQSPSTAVAAAAVPAAWFAQLVALAPELRRHPPRRHLTPHLAC